ncbi:MAG: hypothetical protein HY920_08175 [Elusimicrobia bacterium]|nr:hypothetical protein [Elusimicrobiota bacterium]
MWFENLDVAGLPDKSGEGLYAVVYYYFTAFVTATIVWALWRLFELKTYLWQNMAALAVLTGLMLLVLEGLRKQKQWARIVLLIEYGIFALASVYFLGINIFGILKEYSSERFTAIFVYIMLAVLWGYGLYQMSFNSKVKTINWK